MQFWHTFCCLLGQSGRTNQTLESTLRCVASSNPSSWIRHIARAEYRRNTLRNASSGLRGMRGCCPPHTSSGSVGPPGGGYERLSCTPPPVRRHSPTGIDTGLGNGCNWRQRICHSGWSPSSPIYWAIQDHPQNQSGYGLSTAPVLREGSSHLPSLLTEAGACQCFGATLGAITFTPHCWGTAGIHSALHSGQSAGRQGGTIYGWLGGLLTRGALLGSL